MTDLIPGIVQDADSGRVLMLGYLNQEAIDLTVETGFVHFWSRSRSEMWKKGETSGNTLRFVSMAGDCDSDALLIQAHPDGPTCHTGAVSCFDAGDGPPRLEDSALPPPAAGGETSALPRRLTEEASPPSAVGETSFLPRRQTGEVASPEGEGGGGDPSFDLGSLWQTIQQRRTERPAGSYTVQLFEGGVDLTGRKVLEEAGEVLMAAKDHAAGTTDDRRVAEEAGDLVYHLLVLLAERGIALREVFDVLEEREG